jgi:subtilase family serine protease
MRGTSLPRLLLVSIVYVAGLAGIGTPAALAAVQDRITSAVSNESHTQIADSVHPRVKVATDLGPTSGDTKLQGISIRFSMTAEQEAALDQLLADQQNPGSPRYHQWLTPAQFAAQFGLSSADIAKVTTWLTSQGFTVTGVANGGQFVTFDGTVAQAQAAFATSIHNVSYQGETHYANVTNASVPTAFASVVGTITGLHNFRLKPRVHTSVVSPRYTSSVSEDHYLAPGDIYTIYDMNPLLTTYNGAGMTIAVTGQVDISTADVSSFRSASGLSTTNLPTTVHEGTDPGGPLTCNNCSPSDSDLAESSIDVEWSGAMAPSATILFVNGQDVFNNAMTQAIDQNLAPIITTSYGNCEASWGVSFLNSFNQLFKQANAQGQTILAASADVGAADCDAGTSATEGLAVDFPASSPYVTGMGGTMFNEGTATGTTSYWNANSSSTVANGGSATGYIPETAWNEDAAGYSFSAGGGGVSAFFTKPAWQVETGPSGGMTTTVPADASRDVPDLALDAAASHDGYLYCAGGTCTSGFRNSSSNLTVAGGTSFDSQIFGGMLALIEQKIGTRIGNANPTIYALGNKVAYYNATSTSVFHDITTGNNSDPCTAGTPNCPNGGTIGYNAGPGYDLATGWGSVDLNNLASDWNLVTPISVGVVGSAVSATSLTASSTSVAPGANVTLTATVTGGVGTPTGTVQFLVNNTALGSPVTLSNGTATYTYVTSCSNLGQQNMSVAYSGDGNYAGSKGPALTAAGSTQMSNGSYPTNPLIVSVTSGSCPDFTVTASPTTVTAPAGGTIPTVTVTVAPVNGFTGTVVFSATATETTAYVPGFTFSPASVTISSSASATSTMTMTGITANLRMPKMPGRVEPGTMFAEKKSSRAPWYLDGSGVTVASLLLLALPRKRRLGGLLMVLLAAALIGGASGCSSSQSSPSTTTNTNVYAGTYSVNVTATYTSSTSQTTAHSTTVTFVVN